MTRINFVLGLIVFFNLSCSSQAYPPEKLAIDQPFLDIFNAIKSMDHYVFQKDSVSQREFVVVKIDSLIKNEKGPFINEKPYKLLQIKLRGVSPMDTLASDPSIVYVSKYPGENINSLCIKLKNFLFFQQGELPPLMNDTVVINGREIFDYYLFHTQAQKLLESPEDIESVYVSPKEGLFAFKTKNGEMWYIVSNGLKN